MTPGPTRRALLAGMALPLLGCVPPPARPPREFTLDAVPARLLLRGPGHPAIDAWTYGGSVPGPELRVRQGERLRVRVRNRLPQPTTVHWHGVRVPNAMDGVPHLTQPPIAPGAEFVYDFQVPDAGTYWYHSHLHGAEQLERGLAGVLVVEERAPPALDRELTWLLDDWRLVRSGALDGNFANTHDRAHAGRIGNVVSVNGQHPRDVPVHAGERIRLRLVNAANARIFALQFDGHRPRVIAIDGQPVAPHEPAGGRVVIAPGMRIDLLLDATGRPGERHAVGDVFSARGAYDLLHLQYAPVAVRAQPLPPAPALPPNPLAEPDIARAARHEIVFEGGMMGSLHRATLDGQPLDLRALLQRGKAWAINGSVAGEGHHMPPMLTLPRGQSTVLALRNRTRWHHPIHLHGHSFRVLSRQGRPTTHREWQDTVLLAPEEDAEIAFVADNPGDWMFHCHILEHQEGGMMAVVRVA